MSEPVTEEADTKPKSSKLPMIIGLFLALAGAGGGFYAVQSGLLPLSDSSQQEAGAHGAAHADAGEHMSAEHGDDHDPGPSVGDIAFVPIEPLLISLGPGANARHLRFKGQLETSPKYVSEVETLMPRIVDVLNSYLRAVAETDLEKPSALVRLRAQMLRRVQIVTGSGRVNDLLVMEFVLN